MGFQILYGEVPHCYCGLVRGPYVEKLTISGTLLFLNYCEIFLVTTQFTNVATGRTIQVGGPQVSRRPWVGEPCFKTCRVVTHIQPILTLESLNFVNIVHLCV